MLAATAVELAGPAFAALSSWSADTDMCTAWLGIKCDATGLVSEVNLPNMGLAGTLPPEWSALSSLQVISLPGNRLVSQTGVDAHAAAMCDDKHLLVRGCTLIS